MKEKLVISLIIYQIFAAMLLGTPILYQHVQAESETPAVKKQAFFLTVNSFTTARRGGWVEDNWASPDANKLPNKLLKYNSNNGAATTDIYISEPGRYQITAYYKSHTTSPSSRWFQVGVGDTIADINYNSYKFSNFTSGPVGVTGYFEGWDAGYIVDLPLGKKTVGLYASTIGSVRCAAILIYKLDEGETFNPTSQYTQLLDYQDYAPPKDFMTPPMATFISDSSVKIDWQPVEDENPQMCYYDVYKNNTLVTSVNASSSSFTFDNLEGLETYTFRIIAHDAYTRANGSTNSSVTLALQPFLISNPETDFIFTDMNGTKLTSKPAIGQQVKARASLIKQMEGIQTGELIFGLYDKDNILIDFRTLTFNMITDTGIVEAEPITMTDSGFIFKAFLWRSLDNLCPLYKDKIELQ